MKLIVAASIITAGLIISLNSNAQAPAGSTGECKDGTYTTAASKSGACSGHGGVKEWNGAAAPAKASTTPAAAPAAKSTAPAMAPAAATPTAAAKAPAPAMAPATPPAKTAATPMPTSAAAGGGPGQVWVNTKSKVYHCPGDRYYGKTKAGEYMTESAAKAAGDRPDHGKACS